MKNKLLNTIAYTLTFMILIILLVIAYKNFSFKEKNIINHDEIITYKVLFYLNGADYIDNKMLSCTVSKKGCSITLPNATKNDGIVLGYNLNKDDTSIKYRIGDVINISGNMALYVISMKVNTLLIDSSDIDYIEKDKFECTTYNESNTCSITLPNFNKIGYETRGYSTSQKSLSGFIYPNENYNISKNVTLYPIYGITNHLKKLDITKVINYDRSIIEIEKDCSEDVYNDYIGYLNEIKVKAPFLMIGSKITFIGDNDFNSIWGRNYVGMNFGPKNLRSLDVRCSKSVYNDYYGTMVHEMAHSWDFYYGNKMNGNISSKSDVINLFNKYSNLVNRPFRDYSYSNIYEFVADAIKYYYFKYTIKAGNYINIDYPSDIKMIFEKYMCIANNNYDDKKCS